MTNYIARIELHGATESDYQNLHGEMETRGFTRTIKGNDGVTYKLPTAEYYATTSSTLQVVHDAAVEAAQATQKRFWVIVSEAPVSMFQLDPVR